MAASQHYSILVIIICALVVIAAASASQKEADKIASFPGQPAVNFRQYSGYISVDEKQQRLYFYYFVEAESEAASKPLVLWLNGGPGCSSIGAGAFSEHGPFQPSANSLVKNHYSWNKVANMLYLESPAGVGFSYSTNQSFYQSVNDDMTARDNLVFLENWFKRFPEFNNREFYISGESYGGHYVPQLGHLILQSKAKINLKGIAIGNPLLEFNTDFNSRAEYLWSHGLISDATFQDFTFACNYSEIRRQAASGALTPVCRRVIKLVSSEMSHFIDAYDVTLDVCLSSLQLQSLRLNQMQDEPKVNVCVEDETIVYLNRKEVQAAFHARLPNATRWSVCSEVLQYNMQDLEIPTIQVVGELVKSSIRVLVYSGDQDSILPLIGTRTLVNALAKELGLNTTEAYGVWFEGGQVGGWTQVYGDFLSFATIRGASHEAPFSQPERSLVLFRSFVEGKPLPRVNGLAKGKNIVSSMNRLV
ncbi:serine carboxypeptidase-like 45 isoform X1 [Salvia splendens]|uniref:serine carboxypeptidase-like 45 isoform X1 n=1 Tax=Salvia splendens TaxID=180675 RepID=UPI001103F111|nr:serine carboxypeptidase-like 45 isoform X1 [Salvia splendens]